MTRVALNISYRDVDKTDALDALIRNKVKKLERVCDHLISCHVAVEHPQKRLSSGSGYRVRVDMRVPPGHEVVVTRGPGEGMVNEPIDKVVRLTFQSAWRHLQALNERQKGGVKLHPEEQENEALVARLFRDKDYGFLKTLDGRDVYFHRNSVLNDDFDRLAMGTGVRCVIAQGEDGPQASTVEIIDKPGERYGKGEEAEALSF